MEYFAKGREVVNGVWRVTDPSKIVTKAKPGRSFHAYGLAADYVMDGNSQKQGVQWSWEDQDVTKPGIQVIPWGMLGRAAVSLGIEWAGNWVKFREMPHLQSRYGFKISDLYPILIAEGIEAVWKMILRTIEPEKATITVPDEIKTEKNTAANSIVMTTEDLDYIVNDEKPKSGWVQVLFKMIRLFFKRK